MKELTIEQKALAYDEAIKRAKALYDNNQPISGNNVIINNIFPELKESGDERIRNFISNELACLRATEEKGSDRYEELTNAIAWLERPNKNHADNVEPKFKVGDWIVYKNNIWKICNISLKTYYELLKTNNEVIIRHNENVDKTAHLWTIQDAKDGDVLAVENMIFIFKTVLASHIVSYCKLFNNKFERFSDGRTCCEGNSKVHPATKEQRDTLMKAMADAGYTFDFDKKELKKIEEDVNGEDYGIDSLYHAQKILEKTLGKVDGYQSDDGILEHKCAITAVKKLYVQNPNWSEEDKEYLAACIEVIDNFYTLSGEFKTLTKINVFRKEYAEKLKSWLKSLKDKVGCEVNCTTTKEWSEEDEDVISKAESWLNTLCYYLDTSPEYIPDIKDVINKLKSISSKNTWKPSEEQIGVIEAVINNKSFQRRHLDSLYEQLKKLREG